MALRHHHHHRHQTPPRLPLHPPRLRPHHLHHRLNLSHYPLP